MAFCYGSWSWLLRFLFQVSFPTLLSQMVCFKWSLLFHLRNRFISQRSLPKTAGTCIYFKFFPKLFLFPLASGSKSYQVGAYLNRCHFLYQSSERFFNDTLQHIPGYTGDFHTFCCISLYRSSPSGEVWQFAPLAK